jgi:hypothetical protein
MVGYLSALYSRPYTLHELFSSTRSINRLQQHQPWCKSRQDILLAGIPYLVFGYGEFEI